MGIQFLKAPAESLLALEEALQLMSPADTKIASLLTNAKDNPDDHLQHKINTVDLEHMASGEGLTKARYIGWSYLVQTDDGGHFAIEVLCETNGSNHQFSELNKGPFVEGIRRVLEIAKLHQKINSGSYTFSMLRIPALYVVALWFHGQDDAEDLIIPVQPTHPSLASGRTVFTIDQFHAALQDDAVRRLAFDDSPTL